jgi:hypothetical protein
MNRATLLGAALTLTVSVAGCGASPEDKAQDAGQRIGASVAKIQTSTSAQAVGEQIDAITRQLRSIRAELPAAYNTQVESIGEELRGEVDAANGDPSKVRQAFRHAADALRELNSATNSVVNELRRGVREGYDDALN